jgi:hypothetical protein
MGSSASASTCGAPYVFNPPPFAAEGAGGGRSSINSGFVDSSSGL